MDIFVSAVVFNYLAGGQADGRTSGQADGRTGGRADERTGGRADERTGGQADKGDKRTSGQMK
jgi:hypothetical protein